MCPRCGARSFNPNDVAEGYCGRCHVWADDDAAIVRARESYAAGVLHAALLESSHVLRLEPATNDVEEDTGAIHVWFAPPIGRLIPGRWRITIEADAEPEPVAEGLDVGTCR